MTNNVYWTIRADVNEGKLEELTELMNLLVEQTREQEPGALGYEWWLSEDKGSLHIVERYADSDAVMTHMQNVGPHLPKLLGCVTMTEPINMYGAPNDAVKAAFAEMGPVYLSTFGGFAR